MTLIARLKQAGFKQEDVEFDSRYNSSNRKFVIATKHL